ncbi:MFS transporter [Bombiscardovia nodaiensis]|uniref:MFS transporter n=1 Tax=Bombiscardovia nodaiensis TaxID=2932181 RepID=A0ABN6SE10_9BIFI|nr:MFS transporter [Bombiscardovia nodaiensis]
MAEQTQEQREESLILKAMPFMIFICFMQVFSDKMFGIVSPDIAKTFALTPAQVGWLTTIASLVFGVGGAIYSTLSDDVSPRKLFTVGTLMFGLGSILMVAFQFSFWLIIAARSIQVAGAAVIPGCFVVFVRKYLSSDKQAKYLGFNTAMYQLSAALGAVFGGVVSKYMSWQLTMIVPVIVLVALPALRKFLPDQAKITGSKPAERLNIVSIVIFSVAFALILLAINKNTWLWWGIALASVVAYVICSKLVKNPIIDISLFKVPKLISGSLVGAIIYGVQMSFFFVFPFLIKANYDVSSATVGMMYLPANICAFLSGMSSGFITSKIGAKRGFQLGALVILLSQLMFAFCLGGNIIFMWIALALFGVGYTVIYPAYNSILPNALPNEVVGRCMAVNNLLTRLINTAMIAVSGVLISGSALGKELLPSLGKSKSAFTYSNVCYIFALVVVISMVAYYFVFKNVQEDKQAA